MLLGCKAAHGVSGVCVWVTVSNVSKVEQAGTEQTSKAAFLTCKNEYKALQQHCLGVHKNYQGGVQKV